MSGGIRALQIQQKKLKRMSLVSLEQREDRFRRLNDQLPLSISCAISSMNPSNRRTRRPLGRKCPARRVLPCADNKDYPHIVRGLSVTIYVIFCNRCDSTG